MNLKTELLKERTKDLNRKLLKIVLGFAILMLIGTAAAGETYAQGTGNQSVCRRLNFKDTNVDLNGVWALTFGANSPVYTTLVIKGQTGTSVSFYYDSDDEKNRRISQTHRICESGTSIVIVGFNPIDIDTKEKGDRFGYSADNFFISLKNGDIYAYNLDDAGSKSDISIKFVGEIPTN